MSSASFSGIGVIACPGSGIFSKKLIEQICAIEKEVFQRNCAYVAQKYQLSVEEVAQKKNLLADMMSFYTAATDGLPFEKAHKSQLLVHAQFTRFANGEFKTEILESIRSRDIYIVQDLYTDITPEYYGSKAQSYSVNDHLMTLLTTIDTVRSCSPGRITCILPAYPYARQHKRKGREGLTAASIGSLLEFMSVDRILTLDIHSRDIDNTFKSLQLISLHASYEIFRALVKIVDVKSEDIVVVSPDTGAVDRNKYYANSLGCPLAMLYKERDYSRVSTNADASNISSLRLLGNVKDKIVFMADDMLGTGGTLIKAMKELQAAGAKKIIIGISLPLFSADSIQRMDNSYHQGDFYRMIGTNAVGHNEDLLSKEWYINVDVATLFAEAVSALHHDGSMGPLLDNKQLIQSLLNANDTQLP